MQVRTTAGTCTYILFACQTFVVPGENFTKGHKVKSQKQTNFSEGSDLFAINQQFRPFNNSDNPITIWLMVGLTFKIQTLVSQSQNSIPCCFRYADLSIGLRHAFAKPEIESGQLVWLSDIAISNFAYCIVPPTTGKITPVANIFVHWMRAQDL